MNQGKANVYVPCWYGSPLCKANCHLLRRILNEHLTEEADNLIPILNKAEEFDNEDDGYNEGEEVQDWAVEEEEETQQQEEVQQKQQ